MKIEEVGRSVLDCAYTVHKKLGPGLLESVYEAALAKELSKASRRVDRQKPIPIYYDGELLDHAGFRADLVVDDLVLIELKSVQQITDQFKKVTFNYLRLSGIRLGFLINFNSGYLKDGIFRITHGAEGKPFFSSS